MKNIKFYFFIVTYLILGLYSLFTILSEPFLNIELSKSDEAWVIKDITYKNWSDIHGVAVGDIVLELNGTPINEITRLQHDSYIRGASEITIQNGQKTKKIIINHLDLPQQWLMQFILPSINFIIIFFLSFYLFYTKRNIIFINLLIYFMLTMSLAYVSSGASARMNYICVYLNSICIVLCIILLIHFLKRYFEFLKINEMFLKNIQVLYFIPLIVIVLRTIRFIFPNITPWDSILTLLIFIVLIVYLFIVIIYSYIIYKSPKLKLLIISLLIPFFPFIFLYGISDVIFGEPILEADICAAFLLVIPFNVIFFQLTERLFDITYHISRIKYYSVISFIFTCFLTVGIYIIIEITTIKLLSISLYIFISCLLFLYIKETIDYRGRKILFSTKDNSIHKLYKVTQKLSSSYQVKQIYQVLTDEISEYLEIKEVTIVTYHLDTNTLSSTDNTINFNDLVISKTPSIGAFIKNNHYYTSLIYQDSNIQNWLTIEHGGLIRLKNEELIWLELLLKYTNTFIESTKLIEEFMEELQLLKDNAYNEPQWLKKLIWLRVDQEKFNIAQDLHDMFLQEHIHLARQMEYLSLDKNEKNNIKNKSELYEQMIDSISNLRAYCEKLKPPLLSNLGLNVALERLVEKTIERTQIQLVSKFDRLYLENEQLILTIYRIIQELLNNTTKHSQAKVVELSLVEINKGFKIIYRDNGIGCDLKIIEQKDSLGLQGIKERVSAFNGHIILDSAPNSGFYIEITIYEGEHTVDFDIDSR